MVFFSVRLPWDFENFYTLCRESRNFHHVTPCCAALCVPISRKSLVRADSLARLLPVCSGKNPWHSVFALVRRMHSIYKLRQPFLGALDHLKDLYLPPIVNYSLTEYSAAINPPLVSDHSRYWPILAIRILASSWRSASIAVRMASFKLASTFRAFSVPPITPVEPRLVWLNQF